MSRYKVGDCLGFYIGSELIKVLTIKGVGDSYYTCSLQRMCRKKPTGRAISIFVRFGTLLNYTFFPVEESVNCIWRKIDG